MNKFNFLFALPRRFFEEPNETGTGTPPESEDTPPTGDTAESTPPPEGETPPPADTITPAAFEDIVLPEGYEIPEDGREAFLETINNPELSRTELVNKLIEMQAAHNGTASEALQTALQEQFTATQTDWQKQLSALPDFGGANLDKNLAEVKQGMELAGASAEAFTALDLTGAGNHPALVPLLHKLVKPYLEADPTTSNPSEGKLSRESKMFPDMK